MDQEHTYLIIAGTTKAATTSLYYYLADHPEVCAATLKETRFFLDTSYPLPAKYRYEDGVEKYKNYFNHCHGQRVRLEATPDYLYSPGTPHRIRHTLSKVKLVFILRDPIDRLISWYRFAKQRNLIDTELSFEEYVYYQLEHQDDFADVQALRTLEQGRYSKYLARYQEVFSEDEICVLRFESLKEDVGGTVKRICRFAGIEPAFYQNYDFHTYNRTQSIRYPLLHSAYLSLLWTIRMRVHDRQRVRSMLRRIRQLIEPIYARFNKPARESVTPSKTIRSILKEYYDEEYAALNDLSPADTLVCLHS